MSGRHLRLAAERIHPDFGSHPRSPARRKSMGNLHKLSVRRKMEDTDAAFPDFHAQFDHAGQAVARELLSAIHTQAQLIARSVAPQRSEQQTSELQSLRHL